MCDLGGGNDGGGSMGNGGTGEIPAANARGGGKGGGKSDNSALFWFPTCLQGMA